MYQQHGSQFSLEKASHEIHLGMGSVDVSIVMPCLDEIISLPHCIANAQDALARIKAEYNLTGEIVIADNGSADGSQQFALSMGARVVDVLDRGYGAALIGGCKGAAGRFILMGDADGSYDFTDGVAMIGRLAGGADLCMGSRFKGGIEKGAMPWKNRYIGNPILTGILNLFFKSNIDDAHCGLRAITKETFTNLGLTGTGMEFASEMVIKAHLKKVRIEEVPATLSVDLRDRPPHLRPWRDGWRHLRYLLMLSPTWVFGVPAIAMMGVSAVILGIAFLHLIGIMAGPGIFGSSWTISAGFLFTTGHLAAIMAVATHFHGVNNGYRHMRPFLRKYDKLLTLETMIIGGVFMMVAALAGLIAIGQYWSSLGYSALPSTLPLVISAVVGTTGMHSIFGGFLLSIIAGHKADFASATVTDADNIQPISFNPESSKAGIASAKRGASYLVVAGLCALLHNIIMIGLDAVGVHYGISLLISAAVLIPTGFFAQGRVTFNGDLNLANFIRYAAVMIVNTPVSYASLWLLYDLARLPMIIAAPIATVALLVWNFFASGWALKHNRTAESYTNA